MTFSLFIPSVSKDGSLILTNNQGSIPCQPEVNKTAAFGVRNKRLVYISYSNNSKLVSQYCVKFSEAKAKWPLAFAEQIEGLIANNDDSFNLAVYPKSAQVDKTNRTPAVPTEPIELTPEEIRLKFIHEDSLKLRPKKLIISDLKWKFLVRSAIAGHNILLTGDSGSGKTLAAKSLVMALNRPDFYFNLGSTQDPRATLVGNTGYDAATGTYFAESAFVKAIKTPNAIILLDEISRAHPDAWNILMTVLDAGQRYLRLDEAEGSPIVEVAEGVAFVATANIGSEYTATRVIDRALLDRFTIIEIDLLTEAEEFRLLKMLYPRVDTDDLKAISEIATHTRDLKLQADGKLSTAVSTRVSVTAAGLIADGFDLGEAAEITIFPFFSAEGGLESERTYIKQLVQKWIKPKTRKPLYRTSADKGTETETPAIKVPAVPTDDTFDIQF